MRKILVLGGAGYIGSHVCYAFLERGDKVAVLDNFSSGTRLNLPTETEIWEGNILDDDYLEKVFSQSWDGVIHLAAFKGAGESMLLPSKYANNNISGSIKILNAVVKAGCPPLVFSSSAAIFGKPEYLPIDEEHPKNPENFYGFTKDVIEKLLLWYTQLHHLSSASLRYFNAAGYDKAGRITQPEQSPQNLLPLLMETAAGLREKITIYGDDYATPDGTCIRDYIHVSDLADAHVASMDYLIKEKKSIAVNLGCGEGISVMEMLETARRVTGINFPYTMGARRAGDPDQLVSSSALARKILDWKATRSDTETLLNSTWDVYKNWTRGKAADR